MISGYVLAFDFGLRHIGVAVGQDVTDTATPLATISASERGPRWNDVARLIEHWQPVRLLVGLPLNMDGSESEMSRQARVFADELERRFELPVTMVDERLTTFAANQIEPGSSHELAAVIIAQSWLRQGKGQRPHE